MSLSVRVADACRAAAFGLLSVLALSVLFPVLASPVALMIGAAGGLALAYRDRLPRESRSFRIGLALLAIAAAAVVWVGLQPAYIGF